MLSYRHAFHAGNHADVLKHFVLNQVIGYITQKDKPFHYIDTHAGAGIYALDTGCATKNAEYINGISRLLSDHNLPDELNEYVEIIKTFNADDALKFYPGSPQIAAKSMRKIDKLRLFELHPNDFKLLDQSCRDIHQNRRRVALEMADGFAGIKSLLPPPTRRAVVLIDPPYEQKQDYDRVVNMLADSLKRFETGTYMVWYPLLQRAEPEQMISSLKKLNLKNWLHVSLTVQTPSIDGFGMHGSGMFIINPPWTLPAILESNMPYLVETLGLDDGADCHLEFQMA